MLIVLLKTTLNRLWLYLIRIKAMNPILSSQYDLTAPSTFVLIEMHVYKLAYELKCV